MRKKINAILTILLFCLPIFAQDNLLDELMEYYVDEDDLSVVLYVRYGDEDAIAVRGLADYEDAIPAKVDDLYRIGSVTKPFVATLMLQLMEGGLLSVDDRIADYLPSDIVSQIENADTATIRQMLQMTSGIYNYTESPLFDDSVYHVPTYAWSAEETVGFAYRQDAYFPAGEGYYYSNTNYNLAQIIIEGVTSSTLSDELESRIFDPLEMDSCYLETPDVFAQNIVRGYAYYDGYEDVTRVNDGVGLGDGGIVCNAEDLAKFPSGLLHDLLSDESLELMFDTVDDGEGGQYGLGIGYDDSDFGWIIGHDGATSGFQSTLQYLPDEDLVVVVLTNDFDSEIVADIAYDAAMLALEVR